MESQRSFLIIGLALVSYLLWQQWQVDYGPQPIEATTVKQESTQDSNQTVGVESVVPETDTTVTTVTPQNELAVSASTKRVISVVTDTLEVEIDLVGGDIISANLPKYTVSEDSNEPFSLLRSTSPLYIAQSGLVGANGPDANRAGRPRYIAEQESYQLEGDALSVPLTWQNAEGIIVKKTFTFTKGHNDITVSYEITNNTVQAASFQPYGQLQQSTEEQKGGSMFMATYRGAAYSTEENRYEKYKFSEIEDEDLKTTTKGGWVGMLEHYFVSAWIPNQQQTNTIYTINRNGETAIIGFKGEVFSLEPSETKSTEIQLYLGAKNQKALEKLARGLDLTVDYGILWWIAQPLFSLLIFLHSLVNNWGGAIILITIVVKGSMYILTKKQYESMAKMRNLSPKMQQLKDRFGDDRQKLSQAMMELYRKEKVNPMGGCLPLVLQMPIFFALYWVLMESVELRQADFALWITDLSVADPYYVLPVLTGLSMFLLQKLQPNTMTDPMQQKVMQFMPVAMSVFFFFFPAGLVLYWLVSNIITLVQAKIIYASMEKKGLKAKT